MAIKASRITKEILETEQQKGMKPEELTDTFKGKIIVTNPDKSEIAQNMKIGKKGMYAIKVN